MDHINNADTGFSGAVFLNGLTRERVVSLRGIESDGDTIHGPQTVDTQAVGVQGWAQEQIADMELWFHSLADKGVLPRDAVYRISHSSQDGHRVAIFDVLCPEAVAADVLDV